MARLVDPKASYGGVYEAVRDAVRVELGVYRGNGVPSPPFLGRLLESMADGETVVVPAWLLPPLARPKQEPGRPGMTAVVSPDDRVELRPQTAAEVLDFLGV